MFTVLGELPLITINVGNIHLALYLSQVMYLLVAAFVGFIAEFIVGWRLPFVQSAHWSHPVRGTVVPADLPHLAPPSPVLPTSSPSISRGRPCVAFCQRRESQEVCLHEGGFYSWLLPLET